jgi:hypothetical protein
MGRGTRIRPEGEWKLPLIDVEMAPAGGATGNGKGGFMRGNRGIRWVGVASIGLLAASGCTDVSGPEDAGKVRIGFAAAAADGPNGAASGGGLAIEGTNGTLALEEVRLIVAEFELKLDDDDLCPGGAVHDACEEFNAGPSFVDLPLESGRTSTVSQTVPAGAYRELEFEVEDLDDDEDDAGEAQQIRDLLARVRTEVADWPREASMLVSGTFTPRGGAPVAFRVFFDAEIEVELEFSPPLIVEEGVNQDVTVEIDPRTWFRRADGSVVDLSKSDFARTGRLAELEVEIERGFPRLRIDR